MPVPGGSECQTASVPVSVTVSDSASDTIVLSVCHCRHDAEHVAETAPSGATS